MNRIGALVVSMAWLLTAGAAEEPVRFNQVDLQAEVSREVANDLMQATLFAEATDPNAAALANSLNRIVNDALKIAGDAKGIRARSGGTFTYPVYDRNNKVTTAWRGRSEIRLESSDFQAMGTLIGRLQSTMQLGGVSFAISPEARRRVENEMINEAITAFRARADIAAKAIGGRSYKIRRISVATAGAPSPRPMIAMRADAAVARSTVEAPTFEGGLGQVQVNVTGTVEVE